MRNAAQFTQPLGKMCTPVRINLSDMVPLTKCWGKSVKVATASHEESKTFTDHSDWLKMQLHLAKNMASKLQKY